MVWKDRSEGRTGENDEIKKKRHSLLLWLFVQHKGHNSFGIDLKNQCFPFQLTFTPTLHSLHLANVSPRTRHAAEKEEEPPLNVRATFPQRNELEWMRAPSIQSTVGGTRSVHV